MYTTQEIIEILNTVDENVDLEVKKGNAIDKSVMESICAFSNEPNLNGGLIVLGIEREEHSLFPSYIVSGVENPDKLQSDIASQCASVFNFPIRPRVEIERFDDKNIIKIEVDELSAERKPLYFQKTGIPKGIFRRIGPTDQSCTEEDLSVFFGNSAENYDTTVIHNSSLDDISEESVELYRRLIKKVKPNADELEFETQELLYALNAINTTKESAKLTLTGLLIFGKKMALRRLLPMCRVDYIRISGKEWVEDPDQRFESTIDMRGSLLELLPRAIAAIADDLPKGFYLPEGALQSKTETGLPYKVLREAIVNAFIHRSYKVNSPIQIIRYSNRIEINNAGYSLKSIDSIGDAGSFVRNPHIASIFHDTNLAETKGTGIKSMRKLLAKSQMLPPTFESSHAANNFTIRLLLHHLINEQDHNWLTKFEKFLLNDEQKTALIFLREVGALDNLAYRQLTGVNLFQSSTDLRKMVTCGILQQKGNSKKNTYYVPGKIFLASLELHQLERLSEESDPLSVEFNPLLVEFDGLSGNLQGLSGNLQGLSGNLPGLSGKLEETQKPISEELQKKINTIGQRTSPEIIRGVIIELCAQNEYNGEELSQLLKRNESYIKEQYIQKLLKEKKITYTIPEVINHPKQAYKTITQSDNNE
ncbi:putative DNA binding domain-containing protein [Epilithonimonas sp. JDS]|uniref:ATP-binding protein n=1 Tax=Epilithonimonas sp. JDS TaxID=2902797 RepID=UPI001E48543B|nr:ATP-binding protein [Epilithonimonas sp. JDS]MCD9854519.1 putative DNA binding domain-containing protein [Epilithonimonas sp. JDS]